MTIIKRPKQEVFMEQTFVMVKPDGVQRALVAAVIASIEKKGYQLAAIKMIKIDRELASRHYQEHVGKPFYEELLNHITSGPVVAMVWEGFSAVKGIRKIIGATNPLEAEPGSIRGQYGLNIKYNIVHGSDSPLSAEREIALFFEKDEITTYERTLAQWI